MAPPLDTDAVLQRAVELHLAGQLDDAEQLYRSVLAEDAEQFDALHLCGVALKQRGDAAGALLLLDRALAVRGDLAMTHSNRGNALRDLQRHDEALASYDRALALQADDAQTLHNRAAVLLDLHRAEEALACCEQALALQPGDLIAQYNRGHALRELRRPAEALQAFEHLARLASGDARVWCHCGDLLAELGRHDDALTHYDRALALQPRHVPSWVNRGNSLLAAGRLTDAVTSYAAALEIEPGHPFLLGHWLHTKMKLCDWDGLDTACTQLRQGIEQGQPVSRPFPLLATQLGPALQRQCAAIWVRHSVPAPGVRPVERPTPPRRPDGKLHLAYISGTLHNHATSQLMAELFEHHDRSRFEVTALSFGPDTGDAMRQRLQRAFDHFVDVRELSDEQVAALARQRGVHIALDLDGHTQGARAGIFAWRPAPIQVACIGYPGSTASPHIDYLVADATVVPRQHRAHFSEKLVVMPHSFQANDMQRHIADKTPSRSAWGLPETGFVFCCFNASFKITPDVFEVWMRLLKRVEGSVLWLLEGPQESVLKLRAQARRHGMEAARLVFAPRMASAQHLARQRRADLFLDTFYYGAHTTTSDALWAGLPVLTRLGDTFASRVAASLLTAVGLPELITRNTAEYEALALRLAKQPAQLQALTQRLAQHRWTQPLFNSDLYARHLESAFSAMWQKHLKGEPPEHIGFDV